VSLPDAPIREHIIPVGLDNLFSVDLTELSLFPAFWEGSAVSVQRATWFYPSSSPSRFRPVDPVLSHHLERAYGEIKPWQASYQDEVHNRIHSNVYRFVCLHFPRVQLRSALDIGAEAEDKLKCELPEVGFDVIFQSNYATPFKSLFFYALKLTPFSPDIRSDLLSWNVFISFESRLDDHLERSRSPHALCRRYYRRSWFLGSERILQVQFREGGKQERP
jgi:hypothetical protein